MKFPTPLKRGKLVKRYKRFLADVVLDDGTAVTAHCANPGSMLGLKEPGSTVWLSEANNPKRKLKYDFQIIEADNTLVAINTNNPNKLVEEAILADRILELSGYANLKREVKYGINSRIDMLLTDEAKPDCYVEVKNVHLSRKSGLMEFPDSVTTRGAKHLVELGDMVHEGHRAVMVYLIQREDGEAFALAQDLDPTYAKTFVEAKARGVEAIAYECHITLDEITVTKSVPILFPDSSS
ncbi:MAG: DNA/RNA nuclease SfsA [Hyphomicrobiales bacterium]